MEGEGEGGERGEEGGEKKGREEQKGGKEAKIEETESDERSIEREGKGSRLQRELPQITKIINSYTEHGLKIVSDHMIPHLVMVSLVTGILPGVEVAREMAAAAVAAWSSLRASLALKALSWSMT